MGKFAGKRLNLDDEAGGKSGLYARREVEPPGREVGTGQTLALFTDDLARRIQFGRNEIVRQAFIRKKDDFGADHITIR